MRSSPVMRKNKRCENPSEIEVQPMNTTHIRTSKYYPCCSVVYYYSYVSFAMEKCL